MLYSVPSVTVVLVFSVCCVFCVVDDASDLFLPLPSEVTANETADCSRALCVPLEAEPCCAAEASDWLESTDQSLTSLQHLRVDTLLQSQPDLQISMDELSLTHESLCDADAVAPPTAADVSLMPRSPLKTSLQEDRPAAQMPSQEVSWEPPHLTELLERAQVESDVTNTSPHCSRPVIHHLLLQQI